MSRHCRATDSSKLSYKTDPIYLCVGVIYFLASFGEISSLPIRWQDTTALKVHDNVISRVRLTTCSPLLGRPRTRPWRRVALGVPPSSIRAPAAAGAPATRDKRASRSQRVGVPSLRTSNTLSTCTSVKDNQPRLNTFHDLKKIPVVSAVEWWTPRIFLHDYVW